MGIFKFVELDLLKPAKVNTHIVYTDIVYIISFYLYMQPFKNDFKCVTLMISKRQRYIGRNMTLVDLVYERTLKPIQREWVALPT